jgi:cytochrome c
MKKSIVVIGLCALFIVSCGDTKKADVQQEEVKTEIKEVEKKETKIAATGDVELGKKLFGEKTCTACHQAATKVIGPSIKDINAVYSEKGASIVKFLKGESEAIVDTDPAQVAIMKVNLETFVKDLSDDDLKAIAAYMGSIK